MKYKEKDRFKALNREKLFKDRLPKSRVQLEIVKKIEAEIAKLPKKLPQKIINYQAIICQEGEYYLLSEHKLQLEPLIVYLYQNPISSGKLLQEYKELLLLIEKNKDLSSLFPLGINAANFWIDKEEKIYLMPEIFLRPKLNYNQFELEIPKKEYFTPPEIISAKDWDQAAYLFSLTASFYYFLSGQTIFNDQDRAKVLNKIKTEKILDLNSILTQLSPELNELIMQALAKDPSKRGSIEKIAQKIDTISFKNDFKLKAIAAREKSAEQKVIAKKNRNENIKLFFRQSWKLITFFVILGAAFIWGVFSGPQSAVSSQNTAEEVANYFYQGLAKKNISLIKDTTELDLARMERIISESHVVEKMQSAYAKDSETEAELNKIYSLENLNLEEVFSNDSEAIYKVFYEFNFRDSKGRYSVDLIDKIFLEKLDNIWQITKIEGDFSKMIKGNYPWEE